MFDLSFAACFFCEFVSYNELYSVSECVLFCCTVSVRLSHCSFVTDCSVTSRQCRPVGNCPTACATAPTLTPIKPAAAWTPPAAE